MSSFYHILLTRGTPNSDKHYKKDGLLRLIEAADVNKDKEALIVVGQSQNGILDEGKSGEMSGTKNGIVRRTAKDFPNTTWSIDKALILLCMDFKGMAAFCKDNPNIIPIILAASADGTLDQVRDDDAGLPWPKQVLDQEFVLHFAKSSAIFQLQNQDKLSVVHKQFYETKLVYSEVKEQLSIGSKDFYGKLVVTLFQDRGVIDKNEKTIWELSKHKDAAMQGRMASINEFIH